MENTLKDLDIKDIKDRKGFTEQFVNIDELQQIAIKCVKEWVGCEVGKKRFMEFHNITEENLK